MDNTDKLFIGIDVSKATLEVALDQTCKTQVLDNTQAGIAQLVALLKRPDAAVGVVSLEAVHAKEILEQAMARYGTPEIVNTGQGSQFTAEEFTRVVLDSGSRLSMDRHGAWRDNVFVERLWRSVKYDTRQGLLHPTSAGQAGRVR